ncbi:MAG: HAMP domain-containing histidine kinase [Acidimicrobiales bacterium]|nr:MAG: HAMP domain-containing histidine kinase [Acidimicrobiales bacterium]
MSLRVRLLIATGVAVLCGLIVVDLITFSVVTRSLVQQVDDTLQRAHAPIEQVAQSPDTDDRQAIPAIAPGLFVSIVDREGTELLTAPAIEPGREQDVVDISTIDLDKRVQTASAIDGDAIRLRIDQLGDGTTIIVGQSLHRVDETRRQLVAVLLFGSLAAIAAAVALAWWLVGAGLRPLRRVEASAAAITDSDLDLRVPGADQPTEVGNLAAALNEMLDRLQLSSEEREQTLSELRASESRMRRFVADASHELRTPIAATAAYAELFEHGARDHPADLDRAMSGIRRETSRMAGLVDDLLLLARLDEHRPLADESFDLTELVFAAIDAAKTVDPTRPSRVKINEVVTVRGDAGRLRQVVDNLLANVRAHTPGDTPIEVELSTDGRAAVLTVADAGPGVASTDLDHLFDRFYRVDDARARSTGGSGLGLAIVDAIIQAHHGSITAHNVEPHGLALIVRLPFDPPDPEEAP